MKINNRLKFMKFTSKFMQIFFLSIIFLHQGTAAQVDSIEVKAAIKFNTTQEMEVLFTLKNTSTRSISILKDELPWVWSSAMMFVITDERREVLRQVFPIIDPNFEDVV